MGHLDPTTCAHCAICTLTRAPGSEVSTPRQCAELDSGLRTLGFGKGLDPRAGSFAPMPRPGEACLTAQLVHSVTLTCFLVPPFKGANRDLPGVVLEVLGAIECPCVALPRRNGRR